MPKSVLTLSLAQVVVVALTMITAYSADIATWYLLIILLLPFAGSMYSKLSGISYKLNARVFFPVSVGLLCVILFHHFPSLFPGRQSVSASTYGLTSQTERQLTQGFFEVSSLFTESVTVLYAVCAAFLLWKGLNDFDELKTVLSEEASEINSISDYLEYFKDNEVEANEEATKSIRKSLLDYVSNILDGSRIVASEKNDDVMRGLLSELRKLDPKDQNDHTALAEIMKGYSALANLRSRRTVCIEKRTSPSILTIMAMMSISMIGSFFGQATGEIDVNYVYVFLLSIFYTSLFMTLIDLSTPFDGYWSIKTEAFNRLKLKLTEEIEA